MGLFDKSTPSPDMSAVYAAQQSSAATNAAAQANAQKTYQLGEDQLQFSKDQWAHDQPLIDKITQSDIDTQTQQNAYSKTMQDAYTGTTLPALQDYTAKARAWDTPAREKQLAGQAQENVANQFEGQRNSALSQLEGFGIDPSSTRYAALDIGTRTGQGAASAAAGTNAIQQAKQTGLGLEANAVQLGQGNMSGAIGAAGAATGAGTGGAGATTAGLNSATNAMTSPNSYFGSGANYMNAGTNSMNSYVNAVNGFNTAQAGESQAQAMEMMGIGSAIGGIGGAMMPKIAKGGPVTQYDWGGNVVPPAPSQGIPATPGGAVPPQASPTGGQATDDVPSMLTAGEFVVPKDVVAWEGQKSLVGLIDKARKGQQQLSQRRDIGGEPSRAPMQAPTFTSRPQAIPA